MIKINYYYSSIIFLLPSFAFFPYKIRESQRENRSSTALNQPKSTCILIPGSTSNIRVGAELISASQKSLPVV